MPKKPKAPALVKRMRCDVESWKIHTDGGLILASDKFRSYHPAHPVAVVRLDAPVAQLGHDLILQNAALCDHVDLLARQLRLYVRAKPEDSATHAMVRAARRMVRKAKRAK